MPRQASFAHRDCSHPAQVFLGHALRPHSPLSCLQSTTPTVRWCSWGWPTSMPSGIASSTSVLCVARCRTPASKCSLLLFPPPSSPIPHPVSTSCSWEIRWGDGKCGGTEDLRAWVQQVSSKNTSASQPGLRHGHRTLGSFCLDQLSYSENIENSRKKVVECACDAAWFFCWILRVCCPPQILSSLLCF